MRASVLFALLLSGVGTFCTLVSITPAFYGKLEGVKLAVWGLAFALGGVALALFAT